LSKKRRKAHVAAPQLVQQPSPLRPFMSDEAVALLARKNRTPPAEDIFKSAVPPPGVVPEGAVLAMDDALSGAGGWAGQTYGASLGGFGAAISMTVLALYAQRPEYRKIADVPATEMTRRWIKITSIDQDADKTDRIQAIEAGLVKFKVRDAFRDAVRYDGLMGRGHLYIDLGAQGDERAKPIGNGSDAATLQKVKRGSLKGIRSVDPLWVYPQSYNTSDPLAPDWYEPQSWYVMGGSVHASRLLTIVAREVPDILKSAYSFGGLSLTQMAQPYVDNWIRTRQSVSDIVHAFTVWVLKTDMKVKLQGGSSSALFGDTGLGNNGDGLDGRLMMFNQTRDNRGIMALDKDSEDFVNVTANLGTLDKLQAQAFEQVAMVASQPLVKYAGLQPAGLNASSDGEIRVYYDTIHAAQEDHLRDPLQTVIDIIQLSECGDIDPSIRFGFEPLWAMSERERAEVEKLEAETDQIRLDTGVLWQGEVRSNVASDPDSRYPGLDVEDLPDLSAEEAEGLQPKGQTGAEDVRRFFATDAEFEESKHPRDKGGQFAGGSVHPTASAHASLAPGDVYFKLAGAEDLGGKTELQRVAKEIVEQRPDLAKKVKSGLDDLGHYNLSIGPMPEENAQPKAVEQNDDPELPAKFDWLHPDQVRAVREIAAKADALGAGHAGLRVIPSEDDRDYKMGSKLPRSFHWVNGSITKKKLSGTSTVGLNSTSMADVAEALHTLGAFGKNGPNGYYYGSRVALVHGTGSNEGEDGGEKIIKNAKVADLWHKPNDGLSPLKPKGNPT